MMLDPNSHILVIAAPVVPTAVSPKALLGPTPGPISLNITMLQKNIRNFLDSMNHVLAEIPKVTEPYTLDEIELKVEVNAEGNIQLIGGLKAGATGGITFKMKRQRIGLDATAI